jgi:hypothetical protein
MIRVALKGIAGRKLRAALTTLAIVLGVAMVSGTFVFTDTMEKAIDTLFTDAYTGSDAVVSAKDVVDLAAEGVERGDRAPSLERQKAKAVVETRAAGSSLLFAIGVGTHWINQRNNAVADIAAQSPRESTGRRRNTSPSTASIDRRIRNPPATTILSSSFGRSGIYGRGIVGDHVIRHLAGDRRLPRS